jgi:hypothetical protein
MVSYKKEKSIHPSIHPIIHPLNPIQFTQYIFFQLEQTLHRGPPNSWHLYSATGSRLQYGSRTFIEQLKSETDNLFFTVKQLQYQSILKDSDDSVL